MTTLKHVAKHIRSQKVSWDTLTDIWCDNDRIKRFVGIVHAYALGTPVAKIQDEFQCSRSLVLQYARLAGLRKRQDEIAHLRAVHTRLLETLRAAIAEAERGAK